VAAYAGDPTKAPQWYSNIQSVRWRSSLPIAVGSLLDFEAKFLGRRLVYTYRVEKLVPGLRLVMRTASGPFPMETTQTWEPVSDGTLMKLRNRGTPSGSSTFAAPVMAKAMRRAMTKDLDRLATRLAEG
jgi:Polyketide cyclase / dehydrase and lipid transport